MMHTCDRCNGQGYKILESCPFCYERKVLTGQAKLNVQVEKGMPDGATVTFVGEAEQSPNFFAGDVIFKLKTNKHARFTRNGKNLTIVLELSLKESLIGYSKDIPHLDGHTVRVEHDGVT
jgi:DnaJ-related protein SCJ1